MQGDEDEEPRAWFRERTFGMGWTPVTWQGWLVCALFLGAAIGTAKGAQYLVHWLHVAPNWMLASFVPIAIYLWILLRVIDRHREAC